MSNQLRSAVYNINAHSSEEETRALNKLIQHEVTALNPQSLSSLLSFLLMKSLNELFHPTIKFLIQANPSALLQETNSDRHVVHLIAGHPFYCVLMPWIATNYQWVLDNDREIYPHPSVFHLLHQYANRGEENGCTAAIIQRFFEAYPQGLTQVDYFGYTPLHAILMGSIECNADLFKWMVEQCPSNMLKTDRDRDTPLHRACRSLTRHLGDDSSEICKYLIEKCPQSVQMLDNKEWFPIHYLLEHCQHRPVKGVVVCLLRAYPESYNFATYYETGYVHPSSNPFVNHIKPLLDEERELKENVAYLREVSESFHDAVNGTGNPHPLASSTCDFFCNWATVTFVQRLEAKMEQVLTELQNECNSDR